MRSPVVKRSPVELLRDSTRRSFYYWGEEDGTNLCPFSSKNFMNFSLISPWVIKNYADGVFLDEIFLITPRTNLTTNRTTARTRKSHISQMVTLNMRPTKKRPRNTTINVSKIPINIA